MPENYSSGSRSRTLVFTAYETVVETVSLTPDILKRIFLTLHLNQFYLVLDVLRVISLCAQLYIYSHPEMYGVLLAFPTLLRAACHLS